MPDVVGVELESIRLGVFAEDDLRARVEKALPTVAHDRGSSLLEPAATPAKVLPGHPLGVLATGPVAFLSFDLARLPLRALNGVRASSIRFRAAAERRLTTERWASRWCSVLVAGVELGDRASIALGVKRGHHRAFGEALMAPAVDGERGASGRR
jgi:hypothetical protein